MRKMRYHKNRGQTKLDWLQSYHTFSFGHYHDPEQMRFRQLRVINEDIIQPGQGFPEHSHQNMEIITYIMAGRLQHRDSLGHETTITHGEVQRMTAGRGITHSEYNPSSTTATHMLQIWLEPNADNLEPGYEQKHFRLNHWANQWVLLASEDGHDRSLTIHQDAKLYAAQLAAKQKLEYRCGHERHLWLHVVHGNVVVDDMTLYAGDAMGISQEGGIRLQSKQASECLLFDLA